MFAQPSRNRPTRGRWRRKGEGNRTSGGSRNFWRVQSISVATVQPFEIICGFNSYFSYFSCKSVSTFIFNCLVPLPHSSPVKDHGPSTSNSKSIQSYSRVILLHHHYILIVLERCDQHLPGAVHVQTLLVCQSTKFGHSHRAQLVALARFTLASRHRHHQILHQARRHVIK